MIGITAIGSWLPPDRIDNLKQAERFGKDASFASDRIGVSSLPVLDANLQTSDMAAMAVESLLAKASVLKEEVDCLVVCTQNPDGDGLPHTSAVVQEKCGLPNAAAAFDISLGCSGYVYGLHIVKGFMESAGLSRGILVTADPYSKIVDREDTNTSLLFGDAATATLLTDEPILEIADALFASDGSGGENIISRDGRLEMAGRQVFNFAASVVPKQVSALLEKTGAHPDEVDAYIFHQGSRHIVQALMRRLDIEPERAPIALDRTGNTVSSSIPLILEDYLARTDVGLMLLSGFGVGLSWGSVVVKRTRIGVA